MICGLPGTGKSFISRELANRIDAEHLNTDKIRKHVLDKRTYSEEEKNKIYNMLAKEAEKLLKQGKNVIVDATFYLKRHREIMKKTAEQTGNNFYAIQCILPEEEIRKRMEKRKQEKNYSEADFNVYLKIKNIFESLEGEHLVLDTSKSSEEILRKIDGYLE